MPPPDTLSDGGLVPGSFKIRVAGWPYVLKVFDNARPIARTATEFDENSKYIASAYRKDPQTFSTEIMAYAGVPEPAQLVPFQHANLWWTVGSMNLRGTTEGVRSYSVTLEQLANAPAPA